MRRAFSLALIVVILAVTAFLSKPSEKVCFSEARKAFRENLDRAEPAIPVSVNRDVFRSIAEKIFQQSLKVEDRFVYKVIYQEKGGDTHQIGWAAFGYVQVEPK